MSHANVFEVSRYSNHGIVIISSFSAHFLPRAPTEPLTVTTAKEDEVTSSEEAGTIDSRIEPKGKGVSVDIGIHLELVNFISVCFTIGDINCSLWLWFRRGASKHPISTANYQLRVLGVRVPLLHPTHGEYLRIRGEAALLRCQMGEEHPLFLASKWRFWEMY